MPITAKNAEMITRATRESIEYGSMFDSTNHAKILEADILLCRDKEINKALLPAMKNLKWLFNVGAGVDRLPFSTLKEHGIRVANAPNISNDAMSDYAIGAMMMFSCNFIEMIRCQHEHFWKPYVYTQTLKGQTVLIVGAGKIGKSIALKAKAFGMGVLGIRWHKQQDSDFDYVGGADEIYSLCGKADFIISTLPATDKTVGFFDNTVFASMKKTAVFINISRGKVVCVQDLIDSLDNGVIKGAVVDTFEKEPLPKDDPLWDAKNIVITPHSSGRIEGFVDKALEVFIDNYRAYMQNGVLLNEINLDKGY